MFQRYTERARRSIFFARYEVSQFGARMIDTEHLLLGVLREHSKDPLAGSETAFAEIRSRIEQHKPPSGERVPTSVDLPLSHASKRALVYALEEADSLKHASIDNRHLLIGLLREENCFAAGVLRDRGITIEALRNAREPQAMSAWRTAVRVILQDMFVRYTERAQRTIFFARSEASQAGAQSIETEHLLLGLWRQHGGNLPFRSGTMALEEIRREIAHRKPPGGDNVPASDDLPLSAGSERVLAFAAEEANRLAHEKIGDGHILFGLLREEKCLAAEILRAHGITLDEARENLTQEGGQSS